MQDFIAVFSKSVAENTFLKATLSKVSKQIKTDLKNIYLRAILIKEESFISLTYRYKTRDETKNIRPSELENFLNTILGKTFLEAILFTTEQEVNLKFNKKGKAAVFYKKNIKTLKNPTIRKHNREKKRLLDTSEPWLVDLKIANKEGQILKNAQDKWRQINKFLEIVDSLLSEKSIEEGCQIADMGSGKGYLTFALYTFLKKNKGLKKINITGVELRKELVDFCNFTAQKHQLKELKFVAQDIADFKVKKLDMLIALHACDTATDLAIAQGLERSADILILAPCCHKQIRKEMKPQGALSPLLKHGILLERQAEMVTDGIRALLLEREGYKTKIFQFVSAEHTAKNVMITATKRNKTKPNQKEIAMQQVKDLKKEFGIGVHYLETLI